jgi:formate hydrogenlyase transcriptional activator
MRNRNHKDLRSPVVYRPRLLQGDFSGLSLLSFRRMIACHMRSLSELVWLTGSLVHGRPSMKCESVFKDLKLIISGAPLSDVLTVIARFVESRGNGTLCTISLSDQNCEHLVCAAAPSLPEFIANIGHTLVGPKEASCGTAVYRRKSVYVEDILSDPLWDGYRDRIVSYGIRSVWSRPLFRSDGQILGTFAILHREAQIPDSNDLQLLEDDSQIASIAIERNLHEQMLRQERDRLLFLLENTHGAVSKLERATEKGRLKENSPPTLGEIVGDSPVLKMTLDLVSVVAPTGSSVLILGETGTGKELIARAIHTLSGRRERAFVKINCAAIPLGLLESELFGHEKGAFTGAIAQKSGRFELANEGTLFLDEVGDIPLELQAKLLRVLQEQEFERLGSNYTHKVDVRLITATHRDLAVMVKQGLFREDLYYRIKVFPIQVPALRQRTEDIPKLVRHFTDIYSRRMNKIISEIPPETMNALVRCRWPGNIRELQSFIERAVILSPYRVLRAPISELEPFSAQSASNTPITSLEEFEQDHILRVLEASKWVVGGRNGAAERLGMKRTSLIYKMRKFRISRPPPMR